MRFSSSPFSNIPFSLSHAGPTEDNEQLKAGKDSANAKSEDSRGKAGGGKPPSARRDSLMFHPNSRRHSRHHSWHDFSALERDQRQSIDDIEKLNQWNAETAPPRREMRPAPQSPAVGMCYDFAD